MRTAHPDPRTARCTRTPSTRRTSSSGRRGTGCGRPPRRAGSSLRCHVPELAGLFRSNLAEGSEFASAQELTRVGDCKASVGEWRQLANSMAVRLLSCPGRPRFLRDRLKHQRMRLAIDLWCSLVNAGVRRRLRFRRPVRAESDTPPLGVENGATRQQNTARCFLCLHRCEPDRTRRLLTCETQRAAPSPPFLPPQTSRPNVADAVEWQLVEALKRLVPYPLRRGSAANPFPPKANVPVRNDEVWIVRTEGGRERRAAAREKAPREEKEAQISEGALVPRRAGMAPVRPVGGAQAQAGASSSDALWSELLRSLGVFGGSSSESSSSSSRSDTDSGSSSATVVVEEVITVEGSNNGRRGAPAVESSSSSTSSSSSGAFSESLLADIMYARIAAALFGEGPPAAAGGGGGVVADKPAASSSHSSKTAAE